MNGVVLRLVGRRIVIGALTLFLVSALVFFMASLLPGDAAQLALGQYATPETVAMLRKQLGLDEPLLVRFFTWLGGLLSGDFGTSYAANVPVQSIVMARPSRTVLRHALPNSIGPIVNAMALSLSYLLGGVIIVEAIFSYPGLASSLVDAVSNRDLPIVQFCVLFFSACYLLLLLIADIVTIVSNPKASLGPPMFITQFVLKTGCRVKDCQ